MMDPEFCYHESWECTYAAGSTHWTHRCNDCDFSWTNLSRFFADSQVGVCDVCQVDQLKGQEGVSEWETKDSGKREEYASGMVRDTQEGKPRFDLLLPLGVPYQVQFLTRVAQLLARGAEKYTDRNWEKADGSEELARFKSSALRHLMQWQADERDEDHAAAVVFNLLAHETIKWKLDHGSSE